MHHHTYYNKEPTKLSLIDLSNDDCYFFFSKLIIVINASGVKTSKTLDYYGSFLVGANFVIDPYVYILIKHQYRQRVAMFFKSLCCWLCRWRRRGNFEDELELDGKGKAG